MTTRQITLDVPSNTSPLVYLYRIQAVEWLPEWLALDLGPGELAAMALENKIHVVLSIRPNGQASAAGGRLLSERTEIPLVGWKRRFGDGNLCKHGNGN